MVTLTLAGKTFEWLNDAASNPQTNAYDPVFVEMLQHVQKNRNKLTLAEQIIFSAGRFDQESPLALNWDIGNE